MVPRAGSTHPALPTLPARCQGALQAGREVGHPRCSPGHPYPAPCQPREVAGIDPGGTQDGRSPQAGCKPCAQLAPSAPTSQGGPQGAAPTQVARHLVPCRTDTKSQGARAEPRGPASVGCCCLSRRARAPTAPLPSLPERPVGDGRRLGGHVEAPWHHRAPPGRMAPAARPVRGLIKDALIFQAGTSSPRPMVSSTDLITGAGLIGQFPGEACNKASGVEGAGRG